MTYRLYGNDGSGSGIVEMALAEVGAEVELQDVSLQSEAQRSDAYARLNPERKIPTLVTPSGEVLTESAAILLVLDERYPAARLFPERGTPERAQALRWLTFLATELYPIIEIVDYPARFAPDAASAPGVRERAQQIWQQRWAPVNTAIAGTPWLLESGFCATDLYLSVLSRWDLEPSWRAEHLPKLDAIAKAVAQRPLSGPILRRHHPRTASLA
jgi:GST-like protein